MRNMRGNWVVLGVLLVGAAWGNVSGGEKSYPYGQGAVKWVSTHWLASHLKDEGLSIVDTQPNVHDYIAEHIPGAVYFNDSTLRVPRGGLPAQYIPEQAMEMLFRRIGLDNDKPVVVYTGKVAFSSAGSGLEQTMVAYTLARFGHNNVLVLDGGLDKWKAQSRPLSQEFPKVQEGGFRASVRPEYFIDMQQVKKMKDMDNVVLLDARPEKFYQGKGPWSKPGIFRAP